MGLSPPILSLFPLSSVSFVSADSAEVSDSYADAICVRCEVARVRARGLSTSSWEWADWLGQNETRLPLC